MSARDDPALIGYTSGTTGRPKGAVLSHANVLASVEALLIAWRWDDADCLVLSLPLFHMHGLGVGLHGTLAAGATTVLLDAFDPTAVLDAAAQHQASLFFGVPTMYRRLLDHPRAPELGRLRLCVSGSAPLPAATHREFEALTGQRIIERYGMTETVMLVSNPYDSERRPGTVGFPLPGVDVRLEGDPAEIQVRGPNVFSGYLDRPDANAEAFVDGWFRTGDLGDIDGDGYLTISGRGKELIISGGYNVYPREVEDAVARHEGITEVAVTGTPDDQWGEVVTAWIVADRDIEVAELRASVAELLAPYKQPRLVHRVDELPRNALGKVQKHLL
jgi:malonyl-CoA/methylmalonyl-CoA synthetase